MTITTQVSHWN